MIDSRMERFWSPVRRGIMAAALLAATSCAATVTAPPDSWETTLLADHPLTGRIWSTAKQNFVSPSTLAGTLAAADFVLLGEKHDNPDHHRLQAWAIRVMAERGTGLAVAFEMLDPTQEKALGNYIAANLGDAGGIGGAVGWTERGWPDWAIYRPIASAALDAGAPMLAAGAARARIRQVGREGFDALGAGVAADLGLDRPAPASMRAAIREEIAASHCGYLPEAALDPMTDVQFAKDAVMADALRRAVAGRDAAVLIAGAGHARGDRGVPWHLRRMAPSGKMVTIGFTEVRPDETDAAAYQRTEDGPRAFDFLWFTPRVDDDDPCEVFAEQLRRMRENRKTGEPDGGGQ